MGAEIEFCLVDPTTSKAVDSSVFANSTTLNNQEDFISDLYDQLRQQHIDVELVHAESGEYIYSVVVFLEPNDMAMKKITYTYLFSHFPLGHNLSTG